MELETDGTLSSVWDQASVLSNSACSIEHFRFAATKSRAQVLNHSTFERAHPSRVKESADGPDCSCHNPNLKLTARGKK